MARYVSSFKTEQPNKIGLTFKRKELDDYLKERAAIRQESINRAKATRARTLEFKKKYGF